MSRATPSVRDLLRRRLRSAGFDVNGRVTAFHQQLARQAAVTEPRAGDLVDGWLYDMKHAEAINLLHCARLRDRPNRED